MQNPKPHILIAGGGIGGLTAALALARGGAEVDVFERAREFGELGAGLQCAANAMHVLDALGVKEKLRACAFEPERAVLRRGGDGKADMVAPLRDAHEARYGQPYLHVHRADLHRVLLEAALDAGVTLHAGHTVIGTVQDKDTIGLKTSEGDYYGDYVIGADGIKSTVRENLLGKAKADFTGQTAWRALVPTSQELKSLIPPDATVWMGPGRHIVTYYVRGGELINIVAVMAQDDWAEEGWAIAGNPEALRQAFREFDPRIIHLLDQVDNCQYWGLFDRAILPKWSEGRIALMGDAAHPMLPFLAQGAAMAIEDGWVLAHHILHGKWLGDYEAARKKRASIIQSRSASQAGLYHAKGVSALWRSFKLSLARALPALQHSQLDPIYGVNVVSDYPIIFDEIKSE